MIELEELEDALAEAAPGGATAAPAVALALALLLPTALALAPGLRLLSVGPLAASLGAGCACATSLPRCNSRCVTGLDCALPVPATLHLKRKRLLSAARSARCH